MTEQPKRPTPLDRGFGRAWIALAFLYIVWKWEGIAAPPRRGSAGWVPFADVPAVAIPVKIALIGTAFFVVGTIIAAMAHGIWLRKFWKAETADGQADLVDAVEKMDKRMDKIEGAVSDNVQATRTEHERPDKEGGSRKSG